MARDWTIAGRFAPPMAQAAMQGATLADPSNPEGNKLLLRTTALGLGALSRNPQAAAVLYGAAEGGARYIDTGRFGSSVLYGVGQAAGSRVLGHALAPVARVAGGPAEWPVRRIASEATEVYGRYVGNPVKALASALFSKAPAKDVLRWGLGGASSALVEMSEYAGAAGLAGYAINDLQKESAENSAHVNSVPVTASSPAQTPPPPPPLPVPARVAMRMENDEIAMTEALKELQAAGGTNNTEAVAAFRDRTSGIFRRAVKRIHPTLHGGVPYSTAYSAASTYPGEDLGKTAAESIRKTEEYVRGLNPMEWLEKKGDR